MRIKKFGSYITGVELEMQDPSETMVRGSHYFPNGFKNIVYRLTCLTTVTAAV
jgi:hypothetical protein